MRTHHKKLYYSAGLISILLLPILCMIHFENTNAFVQYSSMDIQIWDGKQDSIGKEMTKFLNSKKYYVVDLTGDNNSDKAKLEKAHKLIAKLVTTKDSVNGVKFHFGKHAEYWTYVRALDILAINKAGCFAPYKDDIWFANPKERKIKNALKAPKMMTCGGVRFAEPEEPLINTKEILAITKKYYLPMAFYALMVFFTFRKIWSRSREF